MSVTDDLIAQIFNPDDLLSELAAVQTGRLDPGTLEAVLDRLPADKKNHLQKIVRAKGEEQGVLIWNKIEFVKQISWFSDLPSPLQHRIATQMKQTRLEAGGEIQITGKAGGIGLAMMLTGDVNLSLREKELGTMSAHDLTGILPFMVAEQDSIQIQANANSILYTMTQGSLDELIFDYEEMAMVMYRWASDKQNQVGKLIREMVS